MERAQAVWGHARDLGGFTVRRLLPAMAHRAVGPFVFFDHLGPVQFAAGAGMDVRPHPHIGLATVTWLFDGALLHRDSLGTAAEIRPGEVNWMTAGRGIVHSERTPAGLRAQSHRLHAVQTWVALPRHAEECAPAFQQVRAAELPTITLGDAQLTLVAGRVGAACSPVDSAAPALMLAAALPDAVAFQIPDLAAERALYLASGSGVLDGEAIEAGTLWVLPRHAECRLELNGPAEIMIVGGAPLDGPRKMDWNFVSSRQERIDQARADWAAQRFDPVPGETEFIPLPERH